MKRFTLWCGMYGIHLRDDRGRRAPHTHTLLAVYEHAYVTCKPDEPPRRDCRLCRLGRTARGGVPVWS
jgi:hypothetical protein